MSIWDDPALASGGDYVKFDNPGDGVVGDVLNVGLHTWADGSVCPKLTIRTDDGNDVTLTAGQVRLQSALREQRPEAGDRIKVTFTEVEKRPGGKTMKHFDVQVAKGGAKGTVAVVVDDDEAPF
jgi:hypothetical protein